MNINIQFNNNIFLIKTKKYQSIYSIINQFIEENKLEYNINDFSNYIISNNLYGLVLSFSSLGLGQLYLRQVQACDNKIELKLSFLIKIKT